MLSTPVTARPEKGEATKIVAVEQGLVPAVVLADAPVPRRTIAAEMQRLKVPGVSVAVLHDGRIVWAKGYGVTRADGRAVTPDTLFQAGSISKPVTALAALRLVDQHRLTLDGDVNARLKGWKLPTPPGVQVTLRALLSHTAGTTVHGFPGYAAGAAMPSVDDVLAGRAPANTKPVVVDTPPGTMWRYSGGGYTVIQKLIGDVTGKPFATVLQDEVLRPAGMTHSRFAQPIDAAALATAAWPHDGLGKPVDGGPHRYPELAAAGMWSTPSDLLRYAIAVRDSVRRPGGLLAQKLAIAMLTPGKGDYGLGLEVHGAPDNRAFSHGGSNEGYENFLVAFSRSGDGVAVMTNGAQGNELAMEITRSVAAAYDWPSYRSVVRRSLPIPEATAARMVGNYAIPQLGSFSILRQGAGLALSMKEGVSEPLYAMSSDTYFILSNDLVLRIDRAASDVAGRIVTGPFDVPFAREAPATH
ncbi:serine hydrolase domain-containing protein [uncultured Sphingomonas sp.]|uniref:serine hydrolase domain-containing protein n=1 Tax=uncultured Sphingomonas sp. TaxID=158754 RepID=UPI0025D785B8|nr:serine hydrolase domain-containing protein [uncultured Sphingomonas sp.]